MLSYRFCFYAIHTAPWVLVGGWVLNMLLFPRLSCGDTSPMEGVMVGLVVVYALVGGVLGVKLMRGSLALMCPFCSRPGRAHLDRSEGLGMECPKCGEIRGGGRLGWKIVRDKDEACGPKPAVPVDEIQFRSPWFWGLFGLSVVSAAAGMVIHGVSFFTAFGLLWCFVVASHLVQTLRTGCLNDKVGPTFRSRQPVKYWACTGVWLCSYAFAVYLPVGYALQQRGEMEKKKAEAKAEVRDGVRK